jgi:hypothetical protein
MRCGTRACDTLHARPPPIQNRSTHPNPAKQDAAANSPAQCAAELSRVSLAVYEAGGKAIHVPLPNDHPLVSVIAAALASGGSKEDGGKGGKTILKGAARVADALLDQVVQLQAGGDDGEAEGGAARFARLLALHALAAAEPSLIAPARDPQRFVRALAPYATAPDAEAMAPPKPGRLCS